MERLTERFSNGQAAVYGCGENCKYDFKYCKTYNENCPTMVELYEKLSAYEDAEEQGLLIRLPCKVGDKVYYVQKCLAPSCKECKGFITVNNCYTEYKARIFEQEFDFRHIKAFGKTVFLTREEAEAALERMK